jgi:hypothetical protein
VPAPWFTVVSVVKFLLQFTPDAAIKARARPRRYFSAASCPSNHVRSFFHSAQSGNFATSPAMMDPAIEAHLYDRVRDFLVRRHKMPSRSIGPFSMEAVFGDPGMPRLRHPRRKGVLS